MRIKDSISEFEKELYCENESEYDECNSIAYICAGSVIDMIEKNLSEKNINEKKYVITVMGTHCLIEMTLLLEIMSSDIENCIIDKKAASNRNLKRFKDAIKKHWLETTGEEF